MKRPKAKEYYHKEEYINDLEYYIDYLEDTLEDVTRNKALIDKYHGATEAYSFNKKLNGCFANVMLFTARRASDNAEITVTSDDIENPEKNKELMDWGFGTEVFLCVAWNQAQDMHKWYKNASTQPKMKYVDGMFSVEISPFGDDFVFATYDKIKGKRKDYEKEEI